MGLFWKVLLFVSLSTTLLYSQDSITVQLVPKFQHPGFKTDFLVNGSYAVKSYEKLPEKFTPRFHYLIQLVQLRSNNGFSRITSLTDQWLNSPFVTIPKNDTAYLYPLFLRREMDSLNEKEFREYIQTENWVLDSIDYDIFNSSINHPDDYVKYNNLVTDRYKDVAWRKISDFTQEHPEYLDSIEEFKNNYRKEHYQTYIDSLLQPFYFSQTEITNNQYREFIHYLRDSIATAYSTNI